MQIENYIRFFEKLGLRDFTLLSLKKSNEIFKFFSSNLNFTKKENEFLFNAPSFIDSDLLRKLYLKAFKNSRTYLFTGEPGSKGVVLANAKESITKSLAIAKASVQKTCYILCHDFSYYLRILYNDAAHEEHPDTFLIEMNHN